MSLLGRGSCERKRHGRSCGRPAGRRRAWNARRRIGREMDGPARFRSHDSHGTLLLDERRTALSLMPPRDQTQERFMAPHASEPDPTGSGQGRRSPGPARTRRRDRRDSGPGRPPQPSAAPSHAAGFAAALDGGRRPAHRAVLSGPFRPHRRHRYGGGADRGTAGVRGSDRLADGRHHPFRASQAARLRGACLGSPLFLLLFAATYFLIARELPSSFSEPLNRTDALYFTVTVFATVGFGDIVATTETARVLVIVQMMADLVLVGLIAKVLFGAVQMGLKRKQSGPRPPQDTP